MPTDHASGEDVSRHRYRIHPLAAWTAQRQALGAAPQDLLKDEEVVAVVRLPEGWPLMLQGPPALIWQDLAEAGVSGRDVGELAEPWADAGPPSVIDELSDLLFSWLAEGLVERIDPA